VFFITQLSRLSIFLSLKSSELAKDKKVTCQLQPDKKKVNLKLDELAQSLNLEAFTCIQLELELPKILWVATVEVEISSLVYRVILGLAIMIKVSCASMLAIR